MEEDEESEKNKSIPNMMDLLFYFEQTGVGLPRGEMILLNLAIRKLASSVPIENVRYRSWNIFLPLTVVNENLNLREYRFWGKILGNPKNYYVVEAELGEEELRRRLEVIASISVSTILFFSFFFFFLD